jgi:hypothetical protein
MLLRDIREARLLRQAKNRPYLSFLPFSPANVLDEVRSTHFHDLACRVGIHFVDVGPLACVCHDEESADIYVHQVLNHDQTPRDVILLICKHELLHLRIPPVEKDGEEVQHPPEFWEAEKVICPERTRAWAWIWTNLNACLKQRPRLERIDVLPAWKKVWNQPRTDMETCLAICGEAGKGPPEEGW